MVRFHDFISNQGLQLSDLIGFPRPIRLTIFPNSDTSPGRGVNCRVDSSVIFRPRAPCWLEPQVYKFPSYVTAALWWLPQTTRLTLKP